MRGADTSLAFDARSERGARQRAWHRHQHRHRAASLPTPAASRRGRRSHVPDRISGSGRASVCLYFRL